MTSTERNREYFIHGGKYGKKTFIKRLSGVHGITEYANVEGELLASLLFRAVGAPCLKVQPILIRTTRNWYIETPLIRFKNNPYVMVSSLAANPQILTEVDSFSLSKICILDVLMGNADRSLGNLLFIKRNNMVRLIPIDHDLAFMMPGMANLSFSGFVNGFMGVEGKSSDNGYREWFCRRCGSVKHIMTSTPVYHRFTPAGLDLKSADALYRSARQVVELLSDATILQAIGELPDSIFINDPNLRKQNIIKTLTRRRDDLFDALFEYVSNIHT